MAVRTLSDLVLRIRKQSAGRPDLLSINRGSQKETISTADFLSGIHALALALEARGLKKGARVAIWSENRPEWHLVDFACQLLGLVTVPIYPSLNQEAVGFILRNSGSSWVFFSGEKRAQVLTALESSLATPPQLVALDTADKTEGGLALVLLQGEGAAATTSSRLEELSGRVEPDDVASVIYTSGTTGDPKGVMLTHRNFVSNMLAGTEAFELGPEDQALSFLPLSHVFERTIDHVFFHQGVRIHYSPSVERVPQLLPKVRPTVLCSVPRVYERAYLKVTQQVAKEEPRKQKIFRWALRTGQRYANARLDRFVSPWLALQRALADRLVFQTIRERFGGRLRLAISGGAPLGTEVSEFFEAVGLNLHQGYGMTEAAPVISANRDDRKRLGSVGPPLPGVEVKIAPDGEILVKSEGVMKGYWENPTATAEAIDADGWLHTGDIGELDKDGFLFITDRKKDILVTSGGKNIAPQPIESMLTAQWAVAQAIVIGDNYPYLTALLVPRFEELPPEFKRLSGDELATSKRLRKILSEAVDRVNDRLSDHERIRKFAVLERELSEERGEITPTLKVRRREVLRVFAERIEPLYLKTQGSGSLTGVAARS